MSLLHEAAPFLASTSPGVGVKSKDFSLSPAHCLYQAGPQSTISGGGTRLFPRFPPEVILDPVYLIKKHFDLCRHS